MYAFDYFCFLSLFLEMFHSGNDPPPPIISLPSGRKTKNILSLFDHTWAKQTLASKT